MFVCPDKVFGRRIDAFYHHYHHHSATPPSTCPLVGSIMSPMLTKQRHARDNHLLPSNLRCGNSGNNSLSGHSVCLSIFHEFLPKVVAVKPRASKSLQTKPFSLIYKIAWLRNARKLLLDPVSAHPKGHMTILPRLYEVILQLYTESSG